jgi:hypothetical protein
MRNQPDRPIVLWVGLLDTERKSFRGLTVIEAPIICESDEFRIPVQPEPSLFSLLDAELQQRTIKRHVHQFAPYSSFDSAEHLGGAEVR